jgi:hypothetical protein
MTKYMGKRLDIVEFIGGEIAGVQRVLCHGFGAAGAGDRAHVAAGRGSLGVEIMSLQQMPLSTFESFSLSNARNPDVCDVKNV